MGFGSNSRNNVGLSKISSPDPVREKYTVLSDIPNAGKEKSKISNCTNHVSVAYGFHLVNGLHEHPMEDYVVAETRKTGEQEEGLFAIFDGYDGHEIPAYLQSHLFNNIITEPDNFLSSRVFPFGGRDDR
ncbi:hypothetical protein CerSpe_286840 [Prunus speciosa]